MLRYKKVISNPDQQRIAVIYGTSDLHTANDSDTFTQELHRVYKDENGEIPILEIVRKVNQSWADRKIEQMCMADIRELGNNWNHFMWPTANTIKAKQENTSNQNECKENDEKAAMQKDIDELKKKMNDLLEKQSKIVMHSDADPLVPSRKRKQATLSRIPSKTRKTTKT
eukprot:TRINITY_DN19178_c0_g1_i1.p1 TRINITY_DN19178_c0_g1~~TRINITY_DN19178_c0_g1_i1.p1  ORF type:complete len:170 (+),score=42.20 TRINITY_DN19178_c0_g1_i1:111-620(+)